MNPIQGAIEEIESHDAGASSSYRQVAKKINVDRTTLSRHHQGIQGSNEAMGRSQQLLNPKQEEELVKYIEGCTKRGLPPTRETIQNLGSAVAKWDVSLFASSR
jgi:predicted HicB family RNase H-like nuclease